MTSQGLATTTGYDVAGAITESWDAFLALFDGVDLTTKTRLAGWRVREVAVHLGTWDGASTLSGAIDSLGGADLTKPFDADADNAVLLKAHATATDAEVLAALQGSRDAVVALLTTPTVTEHGGDLVRSQLGPLPLLTLLHAGCYELAVHALDVARATDQVVGPALMRHGVSALADSTACLAARTGVATTVSVVGGDVGWSFTTHKDGSWTMAPATDRTAGPKLSASCVDLLEAASGRANAPLLVARRRIRINDVPGLLALTPVVDQVPGIPGSGALKLAARSLGGLGGFIGKLGRRR